MEIDHCRNLFISFYKSKFTDIDIFNCDENCHFDFNGTIKCNELNFTSVYENQSIKISSSKIKAISINGTRDLSLKIMGNDTHISKMIFSSIELGRCEILAGRINEIVIYDSKFSWLFLNSNFNEIEIDRLDIKNCFIETFNTNNVKFNYLFSLNLVPIEKQAFISNSMFQGEAIFENINFKNYLLINLSFFKVSNLSFSGSVLKDGIYQAIRWPKNYILNMSLHNLYDLSFTNVIKRQFYGIFKRGGNIINNKNVRNINSLSEQYRQLKIISQNSGDRISSLQFYRHEMKANLFVSKSNNYIGSSDLLLLTTSDFFSNFGISYVRPLMWLFSVHLIIFTVFISLGYNDLVFVWPWKNVDGIGISFGQYFYLLNPLHKLPTEENGWILVLDFFSRILNSYFIYYFIKATRKFS